MPHDRENSTWNNLVNVFCKVYYLFFVADELARTGVYDQRDVDNINSNDLYVSQFIRKTESIQDAADRLHEALKWRKEIGVRGELHVYS